VNFLFGKRTSATDCSFLCLFVVTDRVEIRSGVGQDPIPDPCERPGYLKVG
jgi:hypothetical protein